MEEKKSNIFVNLLGFRKNTDYEKAYLRDANVRSLMYMSIVMAIIEVWMLIRAVVKINTEWYVGPEYTTAFKVNYFWDYTKNFWAMLFIALIMIIYCAFYVRSKVKRPQLSLILVIFFAVVCLAFGMYVSYNDFGNGKMLTAFLTMMMFVACLLVWKPYISIVMLTVIFISYYNILLYACQNDPAYLEHGVKFRSGDVVNYVTFAISLVMVAVSMYQQRIVEAHNSEKIQKSAVTDELTGIPNMNYFANECTKRLADESVDFNDYIYLFINVDNFKTYNEQFGFEKGNAYLKKLGECIVGVFEGDVCARQGDDHFVVFAKNDNLKYKILTLREDMRTAPETELYMHIKVGSYKPSDRKDNPRHAVDKARYACGLISSHYDKDYIEYDDEVRKNFKQRQYIVNNIDSAIENGYIKVYYQPVVNSSDHVKCGYEALARWIDPQYGFLSPGAFIPVLEECRLIHKLDLCIFETVCKDLRNIIDAGGEALPVSLNFSRLDFKLMDAENVLKNLVRKYDLPKELIHVEVTESALTDDLEQLKECLTHLKNDGFAIWLDDFGSGYSSLNVLKDYNFDMLKIDMVFLSEYEKNKEKTGQIVEMIIDLANRLGMKTLAEGVETSEQAEMLRVAGCERLQGYLYGKPAPIEAQQ